MDYTIKDLKFLKELLWLDTLLGGLTASSGLYFSTPLTDILGLNTTLILTISIITLIYATVAFILANQRNISVSLLRTLVMANWFWTIVSIGLLFMHIDTATLFGTIFLILQILVVGGLAYFEGNQIVKKPTFAP